MKPWEILGEATTPDGKPLVLAARDGEHQIRVQGSVLMSSRLHHSEEAMAQPLKGMRSRSRVLIGGLGMGFTLRAALDALPSSSEVVVAELLPAVVEWSRDVLGPLAGHPLDDPRTKIVIADVIDVLRTSDHAFDAILLDVDNGPAAFTTASNARLYDRAGADLFLKALDPKGPGLVVIWSAADSRPLSLPGFTTEKRFVPGRPGRRGPTHVLHVARRA